MTDMDYPRPLPAAMNIFSNMAGAAFIALLTLIITPMQVNILGMESYGLVGFIVTLQAICNVLDFGLSTVLTRELAISNSKGCYENQSLIQTVSTIYWGWAIFLGVVLLSISEPLSRFWFNPKELDPHVLVFGVRIISISLALRWPVTLYSSILSGLQRMDWLNLLKVGITGLRLVGGIVVLLIYRDLVVFLWWILITALFEVFAYYWVCQKIYPMRSRRLIISWSVLQPIWRYALKMNLIAILTVLVVQADRLLVSKFLSLEALGYYSLAYSTVSSISLILGAISSALLPSFSASHSLETIDSLVNRYFRFSGMTLFIIGGILFALLFFGELILSIWVSPIAAAGAWKPLAWLSVGFWFSAACSNAYTISVACGRPEIPLRISLISALPYLFMMSFLIKQFGVNGPAIAWLVLNVFYIFSLVPLVHRSVLKILSKTWLLQIFLPFSLLGIVSFGSIKYIFDSHFLFLGFVPDFLFLVLSMLLYGVLGFMLIGKEVRLAVSSLVYDRLGAFWGRALL